MPRRTPERPRILRAIRTRRTPSTSSPAAPGGRELSNYELLELRSRELEEERAHGGTGTPQAPDAEKPLLYPRGVSGDGTSAPPPKPPRKRQS